MLVKVSTLGKKVLMNLRVYTFTLRHMIFFHLYGSKKTINVSVVLRILLKVQKEKSNKL